MRPVRVIREFGGSGDSQLKPGSIHDAESWRHTDTLIESRYVAEVPEAGVVVSEDGSLRMKRAQKKRPTPAAPTTEKAEKD